MASRRRWRSPHGALVAAHRWFGRMSSSQKKGGGLAVEASRGAAHGRLRRPAAGTEAIVAAGSGGLDAIAVSGARFTDWALAQGATSWVKASR